MSPVPRPTAQTPTLAIFLIVSGMVFVTINDSVFKFLAGAYPLYQLVFIRSLIGMLCSLLILQWEGGWAELETPTPGLHLVRGLLVVLANMMFFSALATLPLANAVALFFIAPLFITLFSALFLHEQVGFWRLLAIVVGFAGVLVMLLGKGGVSSAAEPVAYWVYALPVGAAAAYAAMQVMTRKLGVYTKASALAVYIQGVFLLVSIGFYWFAGDGHLAVGVENKSLLFLLREWVWPQGNDWWLLLLLGICSGIVGYTLSAAYKLGNAATISSYEYVALPMAFLVGWLVFDEVLTWPVIMGSGLIAGAGIMVFYRERQRQSPMAPRRALRRG
ncbi:MAG: DMT family transporter [Gammaproteobacteria bacterium]|jgi:S-adenosylmethionine uptake transporter|nr:DMT family transporter [Gammaproteobacteria bacterium]